MGAGSSSRGRTGLRNAVTTLALLVGVASVPISAQAGTPLPLLFKRKKKKKKKDGLTPEQAADRRIPVQEQGQQMVQSAELTAATSLYDEAAEAQGDPILFLDAGDVYLEIAIKDRDIASAQTAKLRGQTAQDILYYHLDSASDYRLVTDEEVGGLLARASELIEAADATVAEIEMEQEAAVAPETAPDKQRGDGRVAQIAGLGLMGVGVVGVGVGIAGLGIGRVNQTRVDNPNVYGTEFDDYDAKGRRGNVLAGVGLALGGVALAAGATLFVIGSRKKSKRGAEEAPPEPDDAEFAIVPSGRGLAITGRF